MNFQYHGITKQTISFSFTIKLFFSGLENLTLAFNCPESALAHFKGHWKTLLERTIFFLVELLKRIRENEDGKWFQLAEPIFKIWFSRFFPLRCLRLL
jgi:hypothetical protein